MKTNFINIKITSTGVQLLDYQNLHGRNKDCFSTGLKEAVDSAKQTYLTQQLMTGASGSVTIKGDPSQAKLIVIRHDDTKHYHQLLLNKNGLTRKDVCYVVFPKGSRVLTDRSYSDIENILDARESMGQILLIESLAAFYLSVSGMDERKTIRGSNTYVLGDLRSTMSSPYTHHTRPLAHRDCVDKILDDPVY